MADFSKEYCENQDPGMPWDFSIQEIGESLNPEVYMPMICEGYGFMGIYRHLSGEIGVLFENGPAPSGDGTIVEIIPLSDLDRLYNEGALPWQRNK